MHNYANRGLVLTAIDFVASFPEEKKHEAIQLINDSDSNGFLDLCCNVLEEESPDSVFVYDGDEPNDDLTEGVMYVCWDSNTNPFYVYVRTITPFGEKMSKMGLNPIETQWVTFS